MGTSYFDPRVSGSHTRRIPAATGKERLVEEEKTLTEVKYHLGLDG